LASGTAAWWLENRPFFWLPMFRAWPGEPSDQNRMPS